MLQLAVGLKSKANSVADVFVSFAEGYAFVREVSRAGHSVEVAGFSGGLHPVEAELERTGESGKDAENTRDGMGGIENRLLTLLKIFVVGERQAFDQRSECCRRSQQAARFAADKFGQVGILL